MSNYLKENCSLVSEETSTLIKGILIFLIILGHNKAFTVPLEKWGIMSYLYMFHVHIFFLLPYLYGGKSVSTSRICVYFVRLYWPYLVFATALAVICGGVNLYESWSVKRWIRLLLFGYVEDIRPMCGNAMLWFLPAMLMTIILKDLYYQSAYIWRGILLTISIVINILYILDSQLHVYSLLLNYVPLGGLHAFRYLLLGVTFRRLLQWGRVIPKCFNIMLCTTIFLVGSYIYCSQVAIHMDREIMCFRLLQIVMPLCVGCILCSIMIHHQNIINRFLCYLGQESFAIYLVSPFVGYFCYYIISNMNATSWPMGILAQFLIVFLSYSIARKLIKGRLRSILLPRSLDELKFKLSLKS